MTVPQTVERRRIGVFRLTDAFRRRFDFCNSLISLKSNLALFVYYSPAELTVSSTTSEVSMGYRLRWVIPNRVYEATIRTVDRQFSFKPNHRSDNPLLEESCPPKALDLQSDIIPTPSIINIMGAAVGRALKRFPIQLYAFEGNITHIHMLFSGPVNLIYSPHKNRRVPTRGTPTDNIEFVIG
jgi:hypothetical protein